MAGNLTERVDRLGKKIVYEYDNLCRNKAEKWYDGESLVRTLSFSFSADGELVALRRSVQRGAPYGGERWQN
jgi:YD repeat-containing protein